MGLKLVKNKSMAVMSDENLNKTKNKKEDLLGQESSEGSVSSTEVDVKAIKKQITNESTHSLYSNIL